MKKILEVICFLFILLPVISAVDFDIKSNYSQGETMIGKFSANFVDSVTEDNVRFYREHVRVSFDFSLTKIGEEYYFYAQLPEKSANYSVRLEDVKYLQGRSVIEEDFIKNFTITNKTADFWVNPGVIVTSEDFELQIQNLNSEKINITSKIETETGDEGTFLSDFFGEFDEGEENSISIITGDIKKIEFSASDVDEDSLKKIILSTNDTKYEISLYVLSTPVSNSKQKDLRFESEEVQIKVSTGEELVRKLKLQNIGKEKLENIVISFSEELTPYLEIPVTEIELIEHNEEIELGLYFAKSVDEKVIEGQIKAQTEDVNSYTAITLIYLKNYEPSDSEEDKAVIKTCSELGGKFCDEGESCSEDTTIARDGVCCEGNCIEDESTSYGWLGWLLLIGVILVIAYFFKKYKDTKGEMKIPFLNKKSNKKTPLKKPIPKKSETKTTEEDALKRLQEFKKKYSKK